VVEEMSVGATSEAARLSIGKGNVPDRGAWAPSSCPSDEEGFGKVVECTRGEEVVRYPICEGCEVRGGGVSPGLEVKLIVRSNT